MGILRVAVSLPLCCGAGVQPSIHVQYDNNVLISMQPLHHGELLLLLLVLVLVPLARSATHAGMQARALALRPALP